MDRKSIIAIAIFGICFILLIFLRIYRQNDLKKDGVLVNAKILRVNFGGKVSGGFDCLINYNGGEKELSSPSSIRKGSVDFIGKTFPAMFLPGTNVLVVLITPKDFEKFNLPFPDSLNWVMPYVLKQ